MEKEKENLKHAEALWKAFTNITRWEEDEKLKHVYYILYLGQFMWLLNKAPNANEGADVLALGVGDASDPTVIGASVRLRRKLASTLVNDTNPPKKAKRFPEFILEKLRFQWGAFDGELPRLVQELEDSQPELNRPFDTCGEQVVFEKFWRLNKTPLFTYALQKSEGEVRIVERCDNCKKAGGPADATGITPHLGKVVTDDPHLLADGGRGFQVPIVTPPVLKFLRGIIKNYSQQVSPDDWKASEYFKVWDDVSMEGSCIVKCLGPWVEKEIDEELAAARKA